MGEGRRGFGIVEAWSASVSEESWCGFEKVTVEGGELWVWFVSGEGWSVPGTGEGW